MSENLNEFAWETPQLIELGTELTEASGGITENDAWECAVS